MVLLTFAYTAPVNPPSAELKLTPEQVWEGLEIKTRHGDKFVPVIEKCTVTSERVDTSKGGNVLVVARDVEFTTNMADPAKGGKTIWKEDCFLHPGTKVVFTQQNGTLVENIISYGANGDMYLTYSFDWPHEDVKETDNDKIAALRKKDQVMAQMAVDSTLEVIRKMVKSGEIKGAS